jgi:hypothetical protein
MFPIVTRICDGAGVSWRPALYVLMLAASASFSTPVSYQTNLMVADAAGYSFGDFMLYGVPLQVRSVDLTWLGLTVGSAACPPLLTTPCSAACAAPACLHARYRPRLLLPRKVSPATRTTTAARPVRHAETHSALRSRAAPREQLFRESSAAVREQCSFERAVLFERAVVQRAGAYVCLLAWAATLGADRALYPRQPGDCVELHA